jgi:putative transposase
MGTVGDCFDNAMMESFWGSLQIELLDARAWNTREELASAIFEWLECWYNPTDDIPPSGISVPTTTNDATPDHDAVSKVRFHAIRERPSTQSGGSASVGHSTLSPEQPGPS